jgi:hypothetical protein
MGAKKKSPRNESPWAFIHLLQNPQAQGDGGGGNWPNFPVGLADEGGLSDSSGNCGGWRWKRILGSRFWVEIGGTDAIDESFRGKESGSGASAPGAASPPGAGPRFDPAG